MDGVYSVIRYVPEPERGESVNIGPVLISCDDGKVLSHLRNFESFTKYPTHLRPPKQILTSVRSYVNTFPERIQGQEPLSFLGAIHHDLENNIQTSEPHPCTFERPDTFLQKVFKTVVVPPMKHHVSRRHK